MSDNYEPTEDEIIEVLVALRNLELSGMIEYLGSTENKDIENRDYAIRFLKDRYQKTALELSAGSKPTKESGVNCDKSCEKYTEKHSNNGDEKYYPRSSRIFTPTFIFQLILTLILCFFLSAFILSNYELFKSVMTVFG